MKMLFLAGIMIVPCLAFADDCRVVEFPDHFEAVCTGDTKPVIVDPVRSAVRAPVQTHVPAASVQQSEPVQMSLQAKEQMNDAARSGDGASGKQYLDAAAKGAAGTGTPYARTRGRQGRPSSDDMNAAIEARRNLIQAASQ